MKYFNLLFVVILMIMAKQIVLCIKKCNEGDQPLALQRCNGSPGSFDRLFQVLDQACCLQCHCLLP